MRSGWSSQRQEGEKELRHKEDIQTVKGGKGDATFYEIKRASKSSAASQEVVEVLKKKQN